MTTNANPNFPTAELPLYDDVGDRIVAARAKNVQSANGVFFGDVGVDVEITVGAGLNTGTPVETAVSVGVVSTTVLAANVNAKYRQFINDSPNSIYLSFAGAAALNQGTRLNANGGAIVFDQYVPTGAVKAISSVANSNLLVTEG